MTGSNGKQIEENDSAHIICLLQKLISSSRDSDDLKSVFTQVLTLEKKEKTDNKTTEGNYHVNIYLYDLLVSQIIKIIVLMVWVMN